MCVCVCVCTLPPPHARIPELLRASPPRTRTRALSNVGGGGERRKSVLLLRSCGRGTCYAHMHVFTHTQTCTQCIHTMHMFTHTHTCTHTHMCARFVCAMCVCMCALTNVHMHTHGRCARACTHQRAHAHTTHTCTRQRTHAHTRSYLGCACSGLTALPMYDDVTLCMMM